MFPPICRSHILRSLTFPACHEASCRMFLLSYSWHMNLHLMPWLEGESLLIQRPCCYCGKPKTTNPPELCKKWVMFSSLRGLWLGLSHCLLLTRVWKWSPSIPCFKTGSPTGFDHVALSENRLPNGCMLTIINLPWNLMVMWWFL